MEVKQVLHTVEDGVDLSLCDDWLRGGQPGQQWLAVVLQGQGKWLDT